MPSVPIIDAVTAILEHEGEIFMARRGRELVSFPGYQAFPGGKVDATDADADPTLAASMGLDARLFGALARELQEELGFDLPAFAATGMLESCTLLGAAIAPSFAAARFNTRFFMLRLRQRPDFTLDPREHEIGGWATPRTWLRRYEEATLLLAPPTRLALNTLLGDPRSAGIGFGDFEIEGSVPMVEAMHGLRQFVVRSHTLPPARHTNCFLLGDASARRILVDPSPESREELDRLQAATAAIGFHEIFLTHHHPDHREFADELARRSGVPIGMSADTQARIRARQPRFFEGLFVKTYADGDVVTHSLGQAVRVIAVPGHDEGQLALMPDSRAWCIVGDLIQGIGTVVIAAPEGDMAKYFASMEKIIALRPLAIVPSHGMALGGVYYLEKTLQHRRQRETQIKGLFDAGYSVDEILPEVYQGLSPGLMPLARMNIESHLTKLRAEGAVA